MFDSEIDDDPHEYFNLVAPARNAPVAFPEDWLFTEELIRGCSSETCGLHSARPAFVSSVLFLIRRIKDECDIVIFYLSLCDSLFHSDEVSSEKAIVSDLVSRHLYNFLSRIFMQYLFFSLLVTRGLLKVGTLRISFSSINRRTWSN